MKFAIRSLLRKPALTLVSILTLALFPLFLLIAPASIDAAPALVRPGYETGFLTQTPPSSYQL